MEISRTACFTGHRPQHMGIPDYDSQFKIIKLLEKYIFELHREHGIINFISGMALGVDILAARAVLNLKSCGVGIRLIAALPCREQSKLWSESNREEYSEILSKADEVYCLSEHYTSLCMHERNRFMVDNSYVVIAVWNGEPGGTASTVAYARKQNKEVIKINPNDIFTEE